MTLNAGFHTLWPTPLGVHRYPAAAALNPLLVRMFGALRATRSAVRGEPPGAFFASDDDLLPGQLVLFPSWLAHQALPYEGELDRMVISFNASIHQAHGTDRLHGYRAA